MYVARSETPIFDERFIGFGMTRNTQVSILLFVLIYISSRFGTAFSYNKKSVSVENFKNAIYVITTCKDLNLEYGEKEIVYIIYKIAKKYLYHKNQRYRENLYLKILEIFVSSVE